MGVNDQRCLIILLQDVSALIVNMYLLLQFIKEAFYRYSMFLYK